MFNEFPDVLTMDDMQKALGIGRTMAYRLINNGRIKHMRIGKAIKVPKQFLVDYIYSECYNDSVETGYLPQHKEAV